MGQGAAASGRTHDRAGEVACRGIKSGRLRDERNQERLIRKLIGNSYFVFVDGCWVAVDVDGFTYTQRVICPGETDFVEVVD